MNTLTEDYICESTAYIGPNTQVEESLYEVLQAIPEDAAEFAMCEILFTSVGDGINGIALSMSNPFMDFRNKNWMIVIDASYENIKFVIAHEIAHAYLNHRLTKSAEEKSKGTTHEDREKQVEELTSLWGFQR